MPVKIEPQSEREIQNDVVKALTALGYTVHSTSIVIRGGGHRWNRVSGIHPGIPDLLVGRRGWGPIRLALEMKGVQTKVSTIQHELHQHDIIEIARSVDEALAAVVRFQERYGLPGPSFRVGGQP